MIISVNDFEEAKSYPVMYNNSEILMDNNEDPDAKPLKVEKYFLD